MSAVDATSEEQRVTRLLTVEELADRWRVSRGQVYRLARSGEIPTIRVGRYFRFRPDQIERWEASQ